MYLNDFSNDIFISFIIPVYNTQDFIEECVKSIECQLSDCYEIILVNDGSTDSSKLVCENIQKNSKFVHLYNKENGGLSSARNFGMSHATGRFISFIDSDDRFAINCLKDAVYRLKELSDRDLVLFDAIKFFPNGDFEKMQDGISLSVFNSLKTKDQLFDYLSKLNKFPGSACTKFYKHSFLLNNNIAFPNDKRLSEDLGFVVKCLHFANSLGYIDLPLYEYRQNRLGSITNVVTKKAIDGKCNFIEDIINNCSANIKNKSLTREDKCFLSFAAYEYAVLIYYWQEASFEDKNYYLPFLKRTKKVSKYGKNFKLKVIHLLLYCFGIKLTGKIICLFKRQ